MPPPILVGITGGSGSGKSWLSREILSHCGNDNVAIVEIDWYYHDLGRLPKAEAEKTDFDHPDAVDLDLLDNHLTRLAQGSTIQAPQYDFSTFTRSDTSLTISPMPIIVVEGIFALHRPSIAKRFDISIFVDTPADIRLVRRIRRDLSERGYSLEQILAFWERKAFPSYQNLILPQKTSASLIWESLGDRAFVPAFLADLQNRLARNATKPTPTR